MAVDIVKPLGLAANKTFDVEILWTPKQFGTGDGAGHQSQMELRRPFRVGERAIVVPGATGRARKDRR